MDDFRAAFPGLCNGCIEGDPQFAGPEDFSTEVASPAVDGGSLSNVEAAFESLYGISIHVALDGSPRPQGGSEDLGCYEQ